MDTDHNILSLPLPLDDDEFEPQERRGFLAAILAGAGALATAGLSVPLLRYARPPQGGTGTAGGTDWMDLGALEDFQPEAAPVRRNLQVPQLDGWQRVVQAHSVYIQRTEVNEVRVLSSTCPHLGCSVAWKDDHGCFVCPCHEGRFNPRGERLAGPPPRGLDALECQVEEGRVKVRFIQPTKIS